MHARRPLSPHSLARLSNDFPLLAKTRLQTENGPAEAQLETGLIYFTSSLNRSVTGSMNELIESAKAILLRDEISPYDLGFQLNDLLLSAIAPSKAHGYGKPREAFRRLIDQRESR